ncbi:MAG: PDZ domain-containing protein [Clostridia bacterium]|nr:PDZ domain-containing protein [Clostridia bacterium]
MAEEKNQQEWRLSAQSATGQRPAAQDAEQSVAGQQGAAPGAEQSVVGQQPAAQGAEQGAAGQQPAAQGAEQSAAGQQPAAQGAEQGATGPQPAAQGAEQSAAGQAKKRRLRRESHAAGGQYLALIIAFGVLVLVLVGVGGGLIGAALAAERLESRIENSFTAMLEETGGVVLYRSVDTRSQVTEGNELSVAAVSRLAADAVVEINTETEVNGWNFFGGPSSYVVPAAGSGVIISDNGYILTCYHVIADTQSVSVNLRNGEIYPAVIVAGDQQSDTAILKIEAEGLTVAVMGNSDDLVVGDRVVAIGNPLGELGGSVTSGIISALDREVTIAQKRTFNVIQTDAAINSGNSGGGLFNAQGELIGMVNAKASDIGVEGLAFALPINDLKPVIEDLLHYGYVASRGVTLGVSLLTIGDERTATSYRVDELGCYILQVTAGSNAEYAGLQSGDRIVSIDGEAVSEAQQVVDIISGHQADDIIEIVISRNGKIKEMTITLYGKVPNSSGGQAIAAK